MISLRSFIAASPRKVRKRQRVLRPVRPSRRNELWYKAELLRIVNQLIKVSQEELLPVLKQLEPLYASASDSAMVMDAQGPRESIKQVIERMARRFGGIEEVAKRLAMAAARKAQTGVDETLVTIIRQAIGVDATMAFTDSSVIKVFETVTTNNINLIKSIPTEYYEKLEDALFEKVARGVRYESLIGEVERIGNVTKSRAKLIARDQTSKMNSAFNEARQTSLGIEEYVWQGAADERERASHRANNGKRFRWDQPPAKTGHPGHDVRCRCVAAPFFDLDAMERDL